MIQLLLCDRCAAEAKREAKRNGQILYEPDDMRVKQKLPPLAFGRFGDCRHRPVRDGFGTIRGPRRSVWVRLDEEDGAEPDPLDVIPERAIEEATR